MRGLTTSYILLTVGVALSAPGDSVDHRPIGRSLYDRYCLACHGANGDGHGPAAPWSWGTPRSFVDGNYKWKTTAQGSPPTDDDLAHTIRFGAPGTSMPGFRLDDREVDALVGYVKQWNAPLFKTPTRVLGVGPVRPVAQTDRGNALWASAGCATCHDSKYDLTHTPLHRPRANDDADTIRRGIAQTIATGVGAMPSYAGTLPDADIWALADHVYALEPPARSGIALDQAQIDQDRTAQVQPGTWPGTGDDAALWPIPPNGPTNLPPAEASTSERQCARCHAKQAREWTGSIHASAAGPGLFAQLDSGVKDQCSRCHAPAPDQVKSEGVTCAACHLRMWTRNGPPNPSPTLLSISDYPRAERDIYERSDFCLPCHQLPPRTGIGGRPFLNTYKEWLEGPYGKRGVQCQHCHMPNREHQWLGVHDRDTFRQGIKLDVVAKKTDTGASVVADLINVGAGHYLPTTTTPAVWLTITLVDKSGTPIPGAHDSMRIGRDLYFDGQWHERADTRIPPGERARFAKAWRAGRTSEATAARVTVEVHPDDYYEGFYAQRLADKPAEAIRAQYEQALARSRASHYIAEDVLIQLQH
ncbi:MAG: c-type cytochrome [Kofleriaceae bacterium]